MPGAGSPAPTTGVNGRDEWLVSLAAVLEVPVVRLDSDLDLPAFLSQPNLQPISIEKVNVPRIWSLVTCVKD